MKIKKIYLGTQQIYPDAWRPESDTIAYYKFDGDLNDSSGNNKDIQRASGYTYGTIGEKSYLLNTGTTTNRTNLSANVNPFTVSLRFEVDSYSSSTNQSLLEVFNHNPNDSTKYVILSIVSYKTSLKVKNTSVTTGQWHHVVYTFTQGSDKLYIDGQQEESGSGGSRVLYGLQIISGLTNGKLSEVIFESKARTEQEITNYYDQTKRNYGL